MEDELDKPVVFNELESYAETKANELVEYFMNKRSPKMSDNSRIYLPTAKLFALKVCDEVLGYMGADRGYSFWQRVRYFIEKI
jgi:hypothetical protein